MAAVFCAFSVPLGALVAAYLFWIASGLVSFWGGNPSEVFSHWLDRVLMSGGAGIIAWFLCAEVFFRRSNQDFLRRLCYGSTLALLVANGLIAMVLDGKHGEGTVILAYPLFFISILASTFYILRRCAAYPCHRRGLPFWAGSFASRFRCCWMDIAARALADRPVTSEEQLLCYG